MAKIKVKKIFSIPLENGFIVTKVPKNWLISEGNSRYQIAQDSVSVEVDFSTYEEDNDYGLQNLVLVFSIQPPYGKEWVKVSSGKSFRNPCIFAKLY